MIMIMIIYWVQTALYMLILSRVTGLHNYINTDTELEIAVGHWPFSDQFSHLAERIQFARPNLLYISNGEAIDSL